MANPSHHVPAGAAAPEAPPRFTLRQLPLPAKLVLSTFLLAVGVGYTSAMVQLHMQHGDRDGTTLPTKENVIAVFAGKVWKTKEEAAADPTPCKLEVVVMGNKDGGFSSNNMSPAFFKHDGANYNKQAADPARKPKLDVEREGERRALVAWAHAAPNTREQAYRDNQFTLPKELAKLVVTPNFVDKSAPSTTVLVKTLIHSRCVRCHKADGEMSEIPLDNYEALLAYLPVVQDIPEGGGYVDSGRLMSVEKLTQSTHAHLLSFAVLFSCTGLIFAFTGWPGLVRGVVGPLVLVAQVADISCWWLARLPDPYGPLFAQSIIVTGGVVGLGLAAHIFGGLFGMYGPKGKAVLVLLFAAAAGGGGAAWKGVIEPYLAAEKAKAQQKADDDRKRREDEKAKAAKINDPTPGPGIKAPVPPNGPSELERLLTGSWKETPWVSEKGGRKDGRPVDGAMVQAFFKQEGEFKSALKDDPAEAEKLVPQREGERNGLLAWVKAAPDVRKKAFDDDQFALPEALAGKATPDFATADGKALKVRTLIEMRCLGCHNDGNKNGSLEKYEQLSKYFVPRAKE